MDTKKMIGMRIRELRRKAGFSQEEVAERSQMTAKHLSNIELGKENPTLETFMKLSLVFEVDLWELLNFEHQLNRKEAESRVPAILKKRSEDDLRLAFRILNILAK